MSDEDIFYSSKLLEATKYIEKTVLFLISGPMQHKHDKDWELIS